jgi:phosphatidylglycerophosphate synthase
VKAHADFSRLWALEYSHGGPTFTREFSQRLGACIAYLGDRLGFTPSGLTYFGAAVGLMASIAFAIAPASAGSAITIGLVYQLAYGVDCADGQLARATGRTSEFGAWLDVAADYLRNIAIATGVLYVLLRSQELSASLALVAGAALAVGSVIALHTTVLLQRQARATGEALTPSVARRVLRIALDTPTLLLLICVLRDRPAMLAVYSAGMGVLFLLASVLLAYRRLGGHETLS